MTKIAVIETGGKQYLVSEGQKIIVEKIPQNEGKFNFDKVLLIAEEGEKGGGLIQPRVEIGKPYLTDKKVTTEILGEKRLPKVTTFKYHSKTRYRKKKGHRQTVALMGIVEI